MFLTNNLLFIHIPKSADSSVVKVLEESVGGKKVFNIDIHSTFNQFKNRYPDVIYNKKVFCLVRNPYCRFVSIYRFINRDFKLQKWFGNDYTKIKSHIDTFEKFIINFTFPKGAWGGNNHFTQQKEWADNIENVFNIEEPEKINKFFRDNGINQDLPLTNNRKIPSHENAMYREYYNSFTKNIIREKYEDDLNIYNYDF